MTSSKQLINTFINCGHYKSHTTKFNDRSNIDQIHEQVRCLCGSHIPNSFCLMFYSSERKKLIKLNQNQLDDRFNPFSSSDDQDIENTVHVVDLYVIDITDENDTQSGISCNETSPIGSGDIINETESQQDVPISDEVTNSNVGHTEDLLNALLSKEEVDINALMQSVLTNDNKESLFAYSNENQCDSNFSSNDTLSTNVDSDFTDLFDALLTERQLVQNPLVNNDSSEQIATGVAMPPRNHSIISIQCQPSIELNETQNINSNRLYFSLDVKPEQRNIYKSDRFNQKEETKINGYVARIQGIKTSAQRMASVWPTIRIPKSFRNKRNVRLVVFVVSEKLKNGMRIWCAHRDKAFLPKNFTRDSLSINPIEFDINENNLTKEGDLILDLRMTTLWDKLKESKNLYQLDEQSTIELHPAIHDPSSPRLFCILRDDYDYYLNTICLSDFIRSKNASKRTLTVSTVQTNSVVCKRARAK